MQRSPKFGKHPRVEYRPLQARRIDNQFYSLAEILVVVYCTVDQRLNKYQTRDVLYALHLSDREPSTISGILRFWVFNPPERAANRNFVEAWGWPRLKRGETMLDRLTGKGHTGKKETISREHFGALYAALMDLNLQPGDYQHPKIPRDLNSIMPPTRNYNTIPITELMRHPTPEETQVGWNSYMGHCLRRARESTGSSQIEVIQKARGYTTHKLHQATLSKYESTKISPSRNQMVRGDFLKAILLAIGLSEEKLYAWLPPEAETPESHQLAPTFNLGAQLEPTENLVSNPDSVKRARHMNGHGVKISLDANWTKDAQKKEMIRQILLAAHALSMPVAINDEPWEASRNGEGYEYRTVPKTI